MAIARALVSNPKLILADEPTGNLDSRNGQDVMTLLKELNDEGTTIIMVTHSQHDASYASRVICMLDGKIVTDDEFKELLLRSLLSGRPIFKIQVLCRKI